MTTSILLVCRANLCRSPTAEVLLRVALVAEGVDASVSSCGLEAVSGQSPPERFVVAALARGIDLRGREPAALTGELAASADLVLTMTRSLLRAMVVEDPTMWPRSFTLLELARRGASGEPPEPGDSLERWLARVHGSRDRSELLGTDPLDDVTDPLGDTAEGNPAMFDQLDSATRRIAGMLGVLSG